MPLVVALSLSLSLERALAERTYSEHALQHQHKVVEREFVVVNRNPPNVVAKPCLW